MRLLFLIETLVNLSMIGVFARNPELTSTKSETFDHQDTKQPTIGYCSNKSELLKIFMIAVNEDYQNQGKYHELQNRSYFKLCLGEDVYINKKLNLIIAVWMTFLLLLHQEFTPC